jgi:ABC-type branched-subunit amino acid transport system ATPase component
MLGGPRLLLLDEPLAGLHRDQVERVSRFISDWRLKTKSCVLIVDHNLPALSDLAGSIVVLDGGRVLDQGTPGDILSKPEVREVFFV